MVNLKAAWFIFPFMQEVLLVSLIGTTVISFSSLDLYILPTFKAVV